MTKWLLIAAISLGNINTFALDLECTGKLTFQSGTTDAEKSIHGFFLYLNAKKNALEAEHSQYKGHLTLDNKWQEENNITVFQFATVGFAVNLFFTPESADCGQYKTTTEIEGVLVSHQPNYVQKQKFMI